MKQLAGLLSAIDVHVPSVVSLLKPPFHGYLQLDAQYEIRHCIEQLSKGKNQPSVDASWFVVDFSGRCSRRCSKQLTGDVSRARIRDRWSCSGES
jgi:hypothetical protein